MADIKVACILHGEDYEVGSQPPKGYLQWHEWAEIQHKGGLRQKVCGRCGKWKFPQELSDIVDESKCFRIERGKKIDIILKIPVCRKCAEV